jgi:hypothetical protein
MGLIQVSTTTVTSAVSEVTLTGIDSDDVYMLTFINFQGATDTVVRRARITKSGTVQSDAEYDSAFKGIYADASFDNSGTANQTDFSYGWSGTGTYEKCQGIMYLYDFNSSSEYSSGTFEAIGNNFANNTRGFAGGFVHTVASASDGITLRFHTGNVASGTLTLYKVV